MGQGQGERDMVKNKNYIPKRGDIVWVDFNPVKGHEQAGKRPAIIVSPEAYNKKSGLVLICPITSQIKGYPFEVVINSEKIMGVVLVDQIRSVDWKERKISYISKMNQEEMDEITGKLIAIVK